MRRTVLFPTGVLLRLTMGLALAVTLPVLAGAQGASAGGSPTRVVSINPLGLLTALFAAEYEHAFSATSSGAATLSYVNKADDGGHDFRLASLDGSYRLYPSERAPAGFYVGLVAGLSRVSDKGAGCEIGPVCPEENRSGNAVTTGLEVGHSWLFGTRRGVAIGLGVGAKRLYFFGDDVPGVGNVQPMVRFTIGRAF